MNKHKHADLIHAWADGAEIQFKGAEGWFYAHNPTWHGDTEYRIKPEDPKWLENIPKHGVLCWVCDVNESPNSDHSIAIIISSALKTNQGAYWHYATLQRVYSFIRLESQT